MALTKVTGQVIKNTTDVTVGVLTVTNTLAVGGTVSIGGTLTYEDVTNVDAVGLITARNGIVVGSGITLSKDGDGFFTGIVTASSFGAISGTTGTFSGDVTTSGGDLTVTGTNPIIHLTDTDDNSDYQLNVNGGVFQIYDYTNTAGRLLVASDGTVSVPNDLSLADKIIHTGDTNTAIRFPAADTISLETGGSERFRIDSSGFMGLGTNSPTDTGGYGQALDITGGSSGAAIYLRASNGDTGQIALGSADLTIRTRQADPIIFSTDNSERARITSDGKMGLGSASPEDPLHIKSNSGSIRLENTVVSNNDSTIAYDNDTFHIKVDPNNVRGSSAFKLDIDTVNALTVDDNRRVGIGTDIPYNLLAVVGSSADVMIYDTDAYSQNVSGGALGLAGNDSAGVRKTLADVRGVSNGSNLGEFAIRTRRSGGTLTEALRIDSTGKTIIKVNDNNTTRVNATHLQIQNSNFGASACAGIMLAASNGANSEFNIVTQKHSSGTGADFHLDNGTDAMIQISGDNGDIKFGVNGSMINTFTPGNGNTTAGLGVEPRNGAIFLSRSDGAPLYVNTNTANVQLVWWRREGNTIGNVYAQTSSVLYNTSSDYRLKENDVKINDGIERVKKLRPIKFDWKNSSEKDEGFLAHEAQEVVPFAVVGEKDGEKMQQMDYGKLTPLLTAALQEAIAEIESLKAEVAALKG